jgi:VanZ family protein
MSNAEQNPPPQSVPSGNHRRGTPVHALFAVYLIGMAVLFLLPVPRQLDRAATLFDGTVHFVIFLGFSLVYHYDRSRGALRTLLTSILLSGAIELLQLALPYRGGQWADFGAGVAGAVAGVALSLFAARWPGGADHVVAPPPRQRDELR